MKIQKIALVLGLAAALVATGCGMKRQTTAAEDLRAQLEDREREIAKLETSVSKLEQSLERKSEEAQKSSRDALAAKQAAEQAEKRAREVEQTAKSSYSGDTKAGSRSSTATLASGSGLLPPNAEPGHCYARVFVAPTYATETVRVLKREASERIEVVPARYEWADEKVLVKEASTKLEAVPATYEWTTEKVLVKPAHTVWKKGRGPIEKIDDSTGEIMCLVEVPAQYETVKKRVLKSPATTRKATVPAEYKTVRVKKLVEPAKEKRVSLPAEYETITKTVQKTDGHMAWREVMCETNLTAGTVRDIQRALQTAGFSPGPIDGIYGPQTRAAVRKFQASKGLATGGLTMATIKQLGLRGV